MLADRRVELERFGWQVRQRRAAAQAWGEWLGGMRQWDWFMTITFRDEQRARPRMVDDVKKWLTRVEFLSSEKVTWVLSEEWGRVSGRFHMHGLVAGVKDVKRTSVWNMAFTCFGRTRIEPCRQQEAVAHYAAKYATKELGNIWLGGSGLQANQVRDISDLKLEMQG